MLAHGGRRYEVNLSWRSTAGPRPASAYGSQGRSGPALLASGVSESRQGGGRAYDLDACGRLGRRDERARKALQYIPRSLVSARAVHHSVSRWRRSAVGWGSRTELLCG